MAKREVVQVVTPATVVEEDFLEANRDSFVLSISFQKQGIAISYADITSGQFMLRMIEKDGRYAMLLSVLQQVNPREILVNEDDYFLHQDFQILMDAHPAMVTKLPSWYFSLAEGHQRLCSQIGSASLKAFGLEEKDQMLGSAGALLWYLQETAKTSLNQIEGYTVVPESQFLHIDEASRKSLELLTNLSDGSEKYSLYASINARDQQGSGNAETVDNTPLTDIAQIEARQYWVTLLYEDRDELARVRSHLKQVLDLQRLSSRLAMHRHQSKDLVGISQTVRSFFNLADVRYQKLLGEGLDQKTLEALAIMAKHIADGISTEHQGPFEEGKVIVPWF